MGDEIEVDILDVPDKEHLVAWLFCNCTQWAEISQEKGYFEIMVYSRPDNMPWTFQFDTVITALTNAINQLKQHDN